LVLLNVVILVAIKADKIHCSIKISVVPPLIDKVVLVAIPCPPIWSTIAIRIVAPLDADEPIDLKAIKPGTVVEIYRTFEPLLSRVTKPLLNILNEPEVEKSKKAIGTIHSQYKKKIPMVYKQPIYLYAPPSDDTDSRTAGLRMRWDGYTLWDKAVRVDPDPKIDEISVIFLCDPQFIDDQADFAGSMVVCGKVTHEIPRGYYIDLLDLMEMPSHKELEALYFYLHERKGNEIKSLKASEELVKAEPEQVDWLTRFIRQIQNYERKQEERRWSEEKARKEKLEQATQEKHRMEGEWTRIIWENTEVRGPALIVAPLAAYT